MPIQTLLVPEGIQGTSFDGEARLLRGLLNAARSDAPVQDLIDCAELTLTNGLRDTAAMLYGLVALQLGASPITFTLLRNANARAGWWTLGNTPVSSHQAGFSIDLAIDELRELMPLRPILALSPEGIEEVLPANVPVDTQHMLGLSPALALLAQQAGDTLRSVPLALEQGRLHQLLHPLAVTMFTLEPIRIEVHLALKPPQLAELFALEQLRTFVTRNGELLGARSDPALLDRAAHLNPGALGPYFTNLRMLLRNRRDFISLIDAAAGGQATDEELESWSLLLSSHLRPHEVADLVDDLGDHGMVRALRGILVRVARTSDGATSFETACRIRDAGLDLEDLQLAADAQQLIVRWRPTDAKEWQSLGIIQMTMGESQLAETSFGQALFFGSRKGDVSTALALSKAGRPYLVEGGVDNVTARRRIRLARAKAFRGEIGH